MKGLCKKFRQLWPTLGLVFVLLQIGNSQIQLDVTNIKCKGESNGKITANIISGISGTFEYSIDGKPYGPSNVFDGLSKGPHTVKIRDKTTMCEYSKTAEVEEESGLSISIQGGGRFTFCDTEGPPTITLTASASGGTEPYTFEGWAGGKREVRSSQPKQKLNVRDKNNCTGSAEWSVEIVRIVCSRDPNDMIGPDGFGDPKFVSVNDRLPYKIRFENDPEFASAPAQKVVIEHVLDVDLNLFSLQLGNFGFANLIFEVPGKSSFYKKRLNIVDSLGIFVDVTAGIDITENKVFWIFESVDAKTGLEPSDPLLGMLPVNDTITRKGEGFVDFTIVPNRVAQTGDSILAEAAIVFDVNETINTPEIFNVIDAVPPASIMNPLPDKSEELAIPITWSAMDDEGGSGVKDYALFVSENNNAYYPYETGIKDTITVFAGSPGSSYRFFVVATDNVGNVEIKNVAEAATSIDPNARLSIITFDQSGYCLGDSLGVQWAAAAIDEVNILLSQDNGQTYTALVENIQADTGTFKWAIPADFAECDSCLIKIADSDEQSDLEDEIFVSIQGIPPIQVSNDITICTGSFTQLQVNEFDDIIWTPSAGLSDNRVQMPIASPDETTTYQVTGTNTNGCQNSAEVTVSVVPSNTTTIEDVACTQAEAGIVVDTFTNQFNCDSIVITNYILDSEPPSITCGQSLNFTIPQTGTLILTAEDLQANLSDNCGVDEVTLSESEFTCLDVGTKMIEVQVRDFAGLVSSCLVEVEIEASNLCRITLTNTEGVEVDAPCNCLGDGLFEEELTITSLTGENWTVLSTNLMDPETGEVIMEGTAFTESPAASGLYRLKGLHESSTGYNLTAASDSYPEFSISLSNTCYYPEISFAGLDELYCEFDESFVLSADVGGVEGTGTFRIDGVVYDFFNPIELGLGMHELVYTFDAGTATPDNPEDPGCTASLATVFEIKGNEHPICMGTGAYFTLNYTGPDTLYSNENCSAVLDLGDNVFSAQANFEPEQSIVSFEFDSELTGYNLGDAVIAGQSVPVTYIATDNYGNRDTLVAEVTIVDDTPPVAICRDIKVIVGETEIATITADTINDNSTDECDIDSIFINQTEFDISDLGNVPILLTVTDVNGNVSTCDAIVTVEMSTSTIDLPDYVSDFRIFPNPTAEFTTFELDLNQSVDLYYELLNTRGELVHRQTEVDKISNRYVQKLDLKDVPSGTYNLKIGRRNGEHFIVQIMKIE